MAATQSLGLQKLKSFPDFRSGDQNATHRRFSFLLFVVALHFLFQQVNHQQDLL